MYSFVFFFFSSRRRHTRSCLVSWARRCVQETGSEDGVFALTLARCREDSCIGHLPFTVFHGRPEPRTYGDIVHVRMSDLATSALATCPLSITESSCSRRLVRLGEHLSAIGSLPEAEFGDWAHDAVLTRAATISQRCEETLNRERGCPDYWAEDVSAVMERISKAVLRADYSIPEEVRDSGGLATAKEIIRDFGQLLCWWPSIVERTKMLANAGTFIGRRLQCTRSSLWPSCRPISSALPSPCTLR
eukprot:TRINITY_DN30515_c0_g1_i3.p1 TRINITY_DN30515_c0_g1~~TRINITY_DN30515_c0_g1_i3.p1  ORF type:complete len:247 (+),score=-9.18 TRINITY_DN30515_c0_g1_i3:65-805(+)